MRPSQNSGDLGEQAARDVATEIAAESGTALAVGVVGDEPSVRDAVVQVVSALGALDFAVNSAHEYPACIR